MKKIDSVKLLKILPIVGFVLFLAVNAITSSLMAIFNPQLVEVLQNGQSNPVAFYLIQILFILPMLLIFVPSMILIIKIVKNKSFRDAILQREVGKNAKDEREATLIAYAAKRAFAVMHLTLWLLIILYYPMEILVGILFASNAGLFSTFMEYRTLIFLAIPLVMGSYVFHKHTDTLPEKGVGVASKDDGLGKGSEKTKGVFLQNGFLIMVGLILGITIMKGQVGVTQDPEEIREMNAKYQELLKQGSESQAQENLIIWLKEQPSVFDAQFKNDGELPGLKVWYASTPGGKGYLENSWENLETVER